MKKELSKIIKSTWFIGIASFLIGALLILLIRFATYKPSEHTVHYHANFAVYINGQREMFKSPTYYEEEAMCSADSENSPGERAHMHDNINDVVHVEDEAVTWGNFFQNLGWAIGRDYIQTPSRIYMSEGNNKLHVILNGQDMSGITSMANRVIEDKDKLLISYGSESNTELGNEYKSVPDTAQKYDNSTDPGSCGSHAGPTMHDRFKHMF